MSCRHRRAAAAPPAAAAGVAAAAARGPPSTVVPPICSCSLRQRASSRDSGSASRRRGAEKRRLAIGGGGAGGGWAARNASRTSSRHDSGLGWRRAPTSAEIPGGDAGTASTNLSKASIRASGAVTLRGASSAVTDHAPLAEVAATSWWAPWAARATRNGGAAPGDGGAGVGDDDPSRNAEMPRRGTSGRVVGRRSGLNCPPLPSPPTTSSSSSGSPLPIASTSGKAARAERSHAATFWSSSETSRAPPSETPLMRSPLALASTLSAGISSVTPAVPSASLSASST